jgi:hypothetical protein
MMVLELHQVMADCEAEDMISASDANTGMAGVRIRSEA